MAEAGTADRTRLGRATQAVARAWHGARMREAEEPVADAAPHETPPAGPGVVVTVGHGRLAGEALAALVADAGVVELADVRRTPFSRRNPQFNRDRLAATLVDVGVTYRWWEVLGGRRETAPDSPNVGVTPTELRGYADHLAGEGRAALAELAGRARELPLAVMCAEGDPARCHRRLLADALVAVEGLAVVHLAHDGARSPHHPHPAVRVAGEAPRWDRGVDRPLDA